MFVLRSNKFITNISSQHHEGRQRNVRQTFLLSEDNNSDRIKEVYIRAKGKMHVQAS